MKKKNPTLTTSAGAPISNNQKSQTAGHRGPVLMQDYKLIEKLAHQNRERIPERAVHAKGWGHLEHLRLPMILPNTLALIFFQK